jgi:hypothetical protein
VERQLMTNIWQIEFRDEPNDGLLPCKGCDEVDDILCYTLRVAGPYCRECFEALCDPDEALALEERCARLEAIVHDKRLAKS